MYLFARLPSSTQVVSFGIDVHEKEEK